MRKIIAGWLAGIWLCLLLVRLPVQAANLAVHALLGLVLGKTRKSICGERQQLQV